MSYRAPLDDMLLSLDAAGAFADGTLSREDAGAILSEGGALAERTLLPLDSVGDRAGLGLADGVVTTPPGWRAAYEAWIAGGWNGVTAPAEAGGMALPVALNAALMEIWSASNASFALGPVLTAGAVEALARHASPALQALYLPRLVAGTWTGTMNLTEPQAGSDVGALRARAVPRPDGSYAITGQKIYITYGEHDLAENIVHLVLARLPDAPAGHKGISLFLVPKFIPDRDGRPSVRNDLSCVGLERKLGMHAAPTCTMSYGEAGGATGWLVGEPHKGLACMFTMMNNARLAVGVQGVAAAERATQKALAFARTRVQGRSLASPDAPGPILHHPDVARTVLLMQAQTMAARAIAHRTAVAIDRGETGRAGLLTPVAKAYGTAVGIAVADCGVQVHGGMGYIEEAGAAQIWRDVRISAIYEGTNGIQAIDLVTRKMTQRDVFAAEVDGMRADIVALRSRNGPRFGAAAERLAEAVDALVEVATFLQTASPAEILAGASATLHLFGLARGGTALAAMALAAPAEAADRVAVLTRLFAEQLCPEARALAVAVVAGSRGLEDAELALAGAD